MVLIGMSQKYKASSSCRSGEISSGEISSYIEMSQKYKDSPSCRSGEISNGVDNIVS